MPFWTVTEQPNSNSIHAAYRPIIIKGSIESAVPIIYCDIYFNDVYYKSVSITALDGLEFQFDIHDAAKEYLNFFIAENGGAVMVQANPLFLSCYCKLRKSSINSEGFTIPEAPIPVQATNTTPAVAGGGELLNTFYILKSTLQHNQSQELTTHLNAYKQGTWNASVFPLTHRKDGYRSQGSDYYPLVCRNVVPDCLKIEYTKKDGTTGNSTSCGLLPPCPLFAEELVTITPVDNNNGTQTFTISWGALTSPTTAVSLEYAIANSGVFNNYGTFTGNIVTLTLPLGLYDFQFKMIGACGTNTSSLFEDYGITPAACVPISVTGTYTLPDATANTAYSYDIPFTGNYPTLTISAKPAWMTITIIGNNIHFGGTPLFSDIGTGFLVDISLTNTCTPVDYDLTDTIDVLTPVIGLNSWLFNNTAFNCTKVIFSKTNTPTYLVITPFVPVGAGVTITFSSPNEIGASYELNLFGVTAISSCNLVSNGITYPGSVSGNTVTWFDIDIIGGMQITVN